MKQIQSNSNQPFMHEFEQLIVNFDKTCEDFWESMGMSRPMMGDSLLAKCETDEEYSQTDLVETEALRDIERYEQWVSQMSEEDLASQGE